MFTLKVDHDIELQLLQRHHAIKLFKLVEENRVHLREWLPWVDTMLTPFDFENLIPIWLNQFAENSAYNLGILYKGTLVGVIGIHQIDWYNKIASIGYYLSKDAEGHGIVSRSVKAMLNYAYFDLGLNRIEIRCGVKNKKSRAIPERLAFIREGTVRDGELLNGYYHDIIIYSMLAREWNGMHRVIK